MATDPLPLLAARVRNSVLAGVIGDVNGAAFGQPALFDAAPRLSDEMWLALATCEAVARRGGRVEASDVAAVLRLWHGEHRFRGGSGAIRALRNLASGIDWTQSAVDDPDGAAVAAIQAAPLAFVLNPAVEDQARTIRDIVSIVTRDDDAQSNALAMCTAIRESLASERASRADGVPPDSIVAQAIAIAAAHSHDLEDLLAAVQSSEMPRHLACLAGMLVGAAGADVPGRFHEGLPQHADVEAVIEPFAQFVASAGFVV